MVWTYKLEFCSNICEQSQVARNTWFINFMMLKKFSVLTDKKVKNFIFLQVFYNGMVSILTLFVNVFLIKSFGNSSNQVLYYNLILAITQPIAMITSFAISRRKSYLFTQRMGFLFYGLVLVVLCIFSEKVAFLYPLFAVFISFTSKISFVVCMIYIKFQNWFLENWFLKLIIDNG